jgi:hypothetical protein
MKSTGSFVSQVAKMLTHLVGLYVFNIVERCPPVEQASVSLRVVQRVVEMDPHQKRRQPSSELATLWPATTQRWSSSTI